MTHQLLEEAFEKAGKESGKDSMHGSAEFLAEYFIDEYKFSISYKSLIRYYKKESPPNQQVKNYLANFIGYENYEAFVLDNSPAQVEEISEPLSFKPKPEIRSKKIALISLLLVSITGISSYVGFQSGAEDCMVWKEDQYVAIPCTGAANEESYNGYVLENLRKIEVSDTTTFFKNGAARIWYNKSNNKLEYFTSPGIHPENGKTLRPITEYMIARYVRK